MMMLVVASNKNVNRMNTNAVAACMAPLLLRPLLHGDCEIENDFDVGGDGSVQLLQAAAAANHAQAIVITLLEEYDSIFGVRFYFYLYVNKHLLCRIIIMMEMLPFCIVRTGSSQSPMKHWFWSQKKLYIFSIGISFQIMKK